MFKKLTPLNSTRALTLLLYNKNVKLDAVILKWEGLFMQKADSIRRMKYLKISHVYLMFSCPAKVEMKSSASPSCLTNTRFQEIKIVIQSRVWPYKERSILVRTIRFYEPPLSFKMVNFKNLGQG